MSLLQTHGIEKSFGSVQAVDGIDFEVTEGSVIGIIGPNGAGKTTFVNLLTGTLEIDEGSIEFNGTDISDTSTHERVSHGLVRSFQVPQVCLELTVFENIRIAILSREDETNSLFTSLRGHEDSRSEALTLLKQFDLKEKADAEVNQLTHGDRKILDVCMSVALEPKLIVLDEPTSGVASGQQREMMDQLVGLMRERGLTVVFISHDMELVADYSDQVMAMSQGQKLAEGAPEDVLERASVKEQIRGDGT